MLIKAHTQKRGETYLEICEKSSLVRTPSTFKTTLGDTAEAVSSANFARA